MLKMMLILYLMKATKIIVSINEFLSSIPIPDSNLVGAWANVLIAGASVYTVRITLKRIHDDDNYRKLEMEQRLKHDERKRRLEWYDAIVLGRLMDTIMNFYDLEFKTIDNYAKVNGHVKSNDEGKKLYRDFRDNTMNHIHRDILGIEAVDHEVYRKVAYYLDESFDDIGAAFSSDNFDPDSIDRKIRKSKVEVIKAMYVSDAMI